MEKEIPQTHDQGGEEVRFCYAIKKPASDTSKQRNRTFTLSKVSLPEGPRTNVDLPEIDLINQLFRSGTITFGEAQRKMEELRDNLYKARDAARPQRVFNSVNQKILDDYWEVEYSDRDIIHPHGRLVELQGAVEGAGHLSLAVASKQELQGMVDKNFPDPTKQRRMVSRLNQILKHLNRGFSLRKKREVHKPVKYLTLDEFSLVVPHLKDIGFAALCRAAIACGGRIGELFPVTQEDLKTTWIWIETQVDRAQEERDTKNHKKRKAFVIKEGRKWLETWINLEGKEALRKRQHAKVFRLACKKAFPGRKDKHLVFHDLRHSYAIHLLQVLGAPIQLVANSLGNSVHVCEKYYAGFVLTDPGLEFLERLSEK